MQAAHKRFMMPTYKQNASSTLAGFQTRCVSPNPDQTTKIGSGSVLHNMMHDFFGKTELKWRREVGSGMHDLGQFWLHAGCNGCNWPWPKCFRIGSGMFTGYIYISSSCADSVDGLKFICIYSHAIIPREPCVVNRMLKSHDYAKWNLTALNVKNCRQRLCSFGHQATCALCLLILHLQQGNIMLNHSKATSR